MSNEIHIEQEFRAAYHLDDDEKTRIGADGLHLSEIGEEIADDARLSCENVAKQGEVECSVQFRQFGESNVGYVCERNLNVQSPCLDKTMPTACVRKLLESLRPHIDAVEDVDPDFL